MSSLEESSVLKEDAIEDTDKNIKERPSSEINDFQQEEILQEYQPSEESSKDETESTDKQTEKEGPSEETVEIQCEEGHKEGTEQPQSIEEEQESSKKKSELQFQKLEICQKHAESSCETEIETCRISEQPQKQLTSDREDESEFKKETEKNQTHLDLDSETKTEKKLEKVEVNEVGETLKENSKLTEKGERKELEDQLQEAKAREAKAVAELNQIKKEELNCQKIMEKYEKTIVTCLADYQKLREEHETTTRHLANIELVFSDLHQKYERTKALLEGFKSNEDTLNAALQASEKTIKLNEERYEALKAHAREQIEKSNKEILKLWNKYETDVNKLKTLIKRFEIKCGSLEISLQQKTEECAALATLCDEVTGKKV
ncbi:transforming acidic coiled-coil-containing protein 1-like [Anoplophora glabripennis]|uniref:transforming acidic coiled-coil-containing protein 1-like n=1 Tax=Anoplophora glabripennis TaxID=217634 RepID=UPI000874B40D|nr:transforming acidic coiled-coil-containing protein 1-like [Anoplophora glabripennis]